MKMLNLAEIPIQSVDFRHIHTEPGPFCMSFGFELQSLIFSIENVGLINPPLIVEKRPGEMDIVAGYRRIKALIQLKTTSIPCKILSHSEFSPFDCLLVNFYDNLVSREFNDVEKGMLLNRLQEHISKTMILEQFMPLLGLPCHRPTLDLFMRVENELNAEIKEYLAHGGLSLKTARLLLEVEEDSRSTVFHLISSLKLTMNQQLQLVDYLIDISHTTGKPIPLLLDDIQLNRIIAEGDTNKPQTAKAVFELLRHTRYPRLSNAEKDFKRVISRMRLPKGVHVKAPPFFETPQYRLEVMFKEGGELKDKLYRLSRNQELDNLGDPWKKNH
ncbi:MAG: ParB N-terminal domain-containing protein [Desulfatiglans sp.]|nr:ParB N-terminal domain-containing protein [Desulfatiglans sp.]